MRTRSRLVAAAATLLAPAAILLAAEVHGRLSQPHEVINTTITPAGDADDFVFEGAAGWKVTATVKKSGTGDLAPTLELLGTDGSVVTGGVVVKVGKVSAKLTALLPADGRYGLRVRGTTGTGSCTLRWGLAPAKVTPRKGWTLDADTETQFAFGARGGALVSWKFKFKGDGGAQVEQMLDADGEDAGYDPSDETYVLRKPTSESVKNFPVPEDLPGGQFALVVNNQFAPVVATLSVKVVLPKLAPATVTMNAAEPVLTGISSDLGGCGLTVQIYGTNLSSTPAGVLFGRNPASAVVVTGGTECSCRVPGGTGTVDVAFVADDGQESVLPAAYTFRAPPVITSFDPTLGPGEGGTDLTLHGQGFQEGVPDLYDVVVGGLPATTVRVVDSETITCKTPANVAGPGSVILRNDCGEEVVAPGSFTYGTGIFLTTIRPDSVPVFGGVEVIVSGFNFKADDVVSLDGSPVTTSPVLYQGVITGHRIAAADLPAHAAGKVDVKVQPSMGASVTKFGGLAYFTFSDGSAALLPAASATDDWGGVASALADRDGDGKNDQILVTQPAALPSNRPGTRVLQSNGTGAYSDVTASAMPSATATETYGGNALVAGRLNSSDPYTDFYLSRAGTGINWDQNNDGTPEWIEARMQANQKYVDPWATLLFSNAGGTFVPQTLSGVGGLLSIPGILVCNATWACGGVLRGSSLCKLYDYDFRSVYAAAGDLDGDSDSDVVLVNDRSLADFSGTSAGVWVSCYGYNIVDYQYYTATAYGWATRILGTGSNGGLTDRTGSFMETAPTAEEDFRAVHASVADMNGDFLNDILIVHNQAITVKGSAISAARLFVQRNNGSAVTFRRQNNFFPAVTSGSDDWRGDAIAGADLNGDFYRDAVISVNGSPPTGATYSSRVLLYDVNTSALVDRTSAVLGGLLPSGDDGRAKSVVLRDIDKDGDVDMILSTPDSVGAGNRRTRLFLNVGVDVATGNPKFLDGSSLLPAEASDPGNAVTVLLGDVDGDSDLDLVLTDTHLTSGTPVRRTRIWRQDR